MLCLRGILSGKWLLLWLVPVFLGGAAFGLDKLVQTDSESIKATIYAVSRAAEHENPAAIEPFILESYRDSYHRDKEHFIRHCEARLKEPLIDRNIARVVSIEKNSSAATTIFTVRVVFDTQSWVYQRYKSEMFLKAESELVKQGDGRWLISSIEITEIDRVALGWEQLR